MTDHQIKIHMWARIACNALVEAYVAHEDHLDRDHDINEALHHAMRALGLETGDIAMERARRAEAAREADDRAFDEERERRAAEELAKLGGSEPDLNFEAEEREHTRKLDRRLWHTNERRVLHQRQQERRFSVQIPVTERRHYDNYSMSWFERRGGARRVEQRRKPIIRR